MQGRLENEMKLQSKIDRILLTLPSYINDWYLNLKASNYTSSTCRDYVIKIRKFLSYIDEQPMNVTLEQLNIQSIESFMISIQTKTQPNGMIVYTSDSYQLTFWCVLNNLMDFLLKRDYITENYMTSIKRPKNRDLERINNERKFLTKKDFEKIFKVVQQGQTKNRKTFNCYRNRDCAIMLLLMTTGMRETALSEINISDINFDSNTIKVIDKGNKIYYYPLNEQTNYYLNLWLSDRQQFNVSHDALFIGKKNERLAAVGISRIVEKYTQMALGYKLTPHKIRGGFCSILYNETHDTEFVRRAVGHAYISTTQRYIKTKGDEKKKAADLINNILK